jgi:predicted outer membrane repeat protein
MSRLGKILLVAFIVGLTLLGVLTVMAKPGSAPTAPADGAIIVDTTNPADVDDGTCSLIEAIIAANSDASYHGCTFIGGPGLVTIYLQASAVYTLTGTHNVTQGANGLPSIASTVTIEGQNATVLRDPAAANFRIFHVDSTGHLTLKNLTVASGRTQTSGAWQDQSGGALFSDGSAIALDSCTLQDNVATSGGGGVYMWGGDLDISDTIFLGNQSGWSGGAISGSGGPDDALTVTGSTLTNNVATSMGGGIYYFGGLTVTDTTIISNTSYGPGGGIYTQAYYLYGHTVSLNDVTIRANTSLGDGGGMHVGAAAILNRVTIDNNRSSANGGGIYMSQYQDAGSLSMTNSTIYGNAAQISGGGLYVNYPGTGVLVTANIRYTTFASNTATTGAGGSLYNNQSFVILQSNIVINGASGSGGANCDGNPTAGLVSYGYNVESGTDCGFTATGDAQNATVTLGPLQDNGGSTHTMALLSGPAGDLIPLGINGCGTTITTDQRGASRPRGIGCDAGAYEGIGWTVKLPLILRQ